MKRLMIAAAAASALALAACETATPYQPLGASQTSGGFSEMRIEPDRWRVNFAGNSLTSRERVETFLLYRAAELTVSQGFDWFAMVDRKTDRDTRYYSDPIGPRFGPGFGYGYGPGWGLGGYWGPSWRYYRNGGWGGWGGWGGGWGNDFDIRQVTRFEANAEIVMGRGAKPEGDRRAFDARAVMDNLNGRIVRPSA
jgi:hypothetical protein